MRHIPGSSALLAFSLSLGALSLNALFLNALFLDSPAVAQDVATLDKPKDIEKELDKTEEEWLAIGDGLADEKKYTEALIAYKKGYETIVGRFRGREFKKPVEPRFMTRPELQEYMLREFKKEIKPEEMRFMDRSLKVFGYAPVDLDVEETMLKLYTEEVAGFYNPRSKEMFLIQEAPKKGSTIGLFKKLVGFKEFNKEEQKTTLAHEMTHALADQYYDLQALTDATDGNDDMAMAVSALIEGEATLLMLGEMLSENRHEGAVWEIRTSQVEATFGFAANAAMVFGGRTMRKAPPVFRKTLIFPYHKGTVFAVHLGKNSDWSGIDRAFSDPPLSTEQVLHPEKYLSAERDHPTAVEFPASDELLGGDWSNLGSNSIGELQLQILFADLGRQANVAAAGWDGDHFEVYEHKDGKLGLAWYTVWDSDKDAKQFGEAYRDYNKSRYSTKENGVEYEQVPPSSDASDTPIEFRLEHEGAVYVVIQQGADVLIADGFDESESAGVLGQLRKAKMAQLKLNIK
jgi:hypothetical protein